MKAFRNSYPAYLFLYWFYFMSTALFTTLISVYLIGQQYSASQVSHWYQWPFPIHAYPALIWLYQ